MESFYILSNVNQGCIWCWIPVMVVDFKESTWFIEIEWMFSISVRHWVERLLYEREHSTTQAANQTNIHHIMIILHICNPGLLRKSSIAQKFVHGRVPIAFSSQGSNHASYAANIVDTSTDKIVDFKICQKL